MHKDDSDEWLEWLKLSPADRFTESMRLFDHFIQFGGTLDPEPDTQSPFYDEHEWRTLFGNGGQACVLYGGAEFSKDLDLVVLLEEENFDKIRKSLTELDFLPIAVPPFELKFLKKGHALHFRSNRKDLFNLRVDLMSKLRGVDSFELLYERRSTFELNENLKIEVLSLPDLVKAKKTQRDKDWPMIRRLVEFHYITNKNNKERRNLDFLALELRTSSLLKELFESIDLSFFSNSIFEKRIFLKEVKKLSLEEIDKLIFEEEQLERKKDFDFWEPLKRELSSLRRKT